MTSSPSYTTSGDEAKSVLNGISLVLEVICISVLDCTSKTSDQTWKEWIGCYRNVICQAGVDFQYFDIKLVSLDN